MSNLCDLYQEIVIDYSRKPRNFGSLANSTHTYSGHNPLCGDQLTVYFREKGGVVKEASFDGKGCAISVASASLMMEALKGKTVEQIQDLFVQFRNLVTGRGANTKELGKLAVLSGVSGFPIRVKCATLCWYTTLAALNSFAPAWEKNLNAS
ncbi:SUF system NifU family Fe-S cluster assembly protein [Coxiella endosymbiont of Amblyomma sculptum]|uniref:Fe-S cluster assembly sulfur transfer protein SufU n=1 Tax=Coxiella endosymbiont of Amblyomma sculptum TaxID=2487929 RepID=UPI00132EFB2F|nr:SUF system NifU family Fe-S cluster assembly protein [Coxiella endosymbiont of Amblyomma sculptum]QHG92530.1 SUF system NifU family Fe-S cluster assembly protein [Coxiella endosymbiont of Amblyomma sculptum]